MEIIKTVESETMTMAVVGRLDAVTSLQFDAEVANVPAEVKRLVFDFARLDFVSSAGLRVIVNAYKAMKDREGGVTVVNPNATVMNVLRLTGLAAVLGMN